MVLFPPSPTPLISVSPRWVCQQSAHQAGGCGAWGGHPSWLLTHLPSAIPADTTHPQVTSAKTTLTAQLHKSAREPVRQGQGPAASAATGACSRILHRVLPKQTSNQGHWHSFAETLLLASCQLLSSVSGLWGRKGLDHPTPRRRASLRLCRAWETWPWRLHWRQPGAH